MVPILHSSSVHRFIAYPASTEALYTVLFLCASRARFPIVWVPLVNQRCLKLHYFSIWQHIIMSYLLFATAPYNPLLLLKWSVEVDTETCVDDALLTKHTTPRWVGLAVY